MELFIPLSILLIMIILGLLVLSYIKPNFFLNIPQRRFFKKLQQVIPDNYIVLSRFPLNHVVDVNALKREYRQKINRKVVDFVIFEKQNLKPIIVIEYDGKTHDREDRQIRDEFIDKVLKSAGIKIIHIKHQQNINFKEIKNKIDDILKTLA